MVLAGQLVAYRPPLSSQHSPYALSPELWPESVRVTDGVVGLSALAYTLIVPPLLPTASILPFGCTATPQPAAPASVLTRTFGFPVTPSSQNTSRLPVALSLPNRRAVFAHFAAGYMVSTPIEGVTERCAHWSFSFWLANGPATVRPWKLYRCGPPAL